VVALWQKACAGVTAEAMELEMPQDALRLFAPLAQWLEEGALRTAGPELPPDPASDEEDDVSRIASGA
jgi:hypothetical protein